MKKNKKKPVSKTTLKSKRNNNKQTANKKNLTKKAKTIKGTTKPKISRKKVAKPIKARASGSSLKTTKKSIPKTAMPINKVASNLKTTKKSIQKTSKPVVKVVSKTEVKSVSHGAVKQTISAKTVKQNVIPAVLKSPVKVKEKLTVIQPPVKNVTAVKTVHPPVVSQVIKPKETEKLKLDVKNVIEKPIEFISPVMNNKKPAPIEDLQVYSSEELKEFETIILEKLDYARKELKNTKDSLSRRSDSGTDDTAVSAKMLEDGAETAQKENLNQLAARMQKFISNLEGAHGRIKNGTYGRCIYTGKLIPKERLRAVPHTNYSIEGKAMQQQKQQSQTAVPDFPPQDFMPDAAQE